MHKSGISSKDYFKSLEQLENDYWGIPTGETYLITTCCQLRKKLLKDFTPEDLRIMIGQNISLAYLIPIALTTLEQNILAQGDFYPGDLLESVLRSDPQFWKQHPNHWKTMRNLFLEKSASIGLENLPVRAVGLFEAFEEIVK